VSKACSEAGMQSEVKATQRNSKQKGPKNSRENITVEDADKEKEQKEKERINEAVRIQ
jgi:hypothetical protein